MRHLSTKLSAMLIPIMLSGLVVTSPVVAANVQISGTVKAPSGFGVGSVIVDILDGSNTTVVSTMTDTSGHYSVSVPSGTNTVRATPPAGDNFQTTTAPSQTFNADATVNLTLVPVTGTVALAGTISDARSNVLPGQHVNVNVTGNASQSATTDSSGRYAVQIVPGSMTLNVSGGAAPPTTLNLPPSYNASTAATQITQDTTLDISLPLKRIAIHVVDAANAPVGPTNLTINTTGGNFTSGPLASGQSFYSSIDTDASGNVVVWLFPNPAETGSDKYTIVATPPDGSGSMTTRLTGVVFTADTDFTITLDRTIPTVTLSGTVRDAAGNGIPGASVTANASSGSAAATTDANGFYSCQVLPGSYRVDIGGNDLSPSLDISQHFFASTTTVSISADTTLNVSLPFKRVTAHVVDTKNAPVANTHLVVMITGSNFPSGPLVGGSSTYHDVTTDALGLVTLWLFPTPVGSGSDTYTIIATPPDGGDSMATTLRGVVVTDDMDLTITLAPYVAKVTLSGTIADALGNGLPGQQVTVNVVGYPSANATTDAIGHYSVQTYPGSISLVINGGASPPSTLNIPPQYSATTVATQVAQDTTLDITLPFTRVALHVVDATNAPVGLTSLSVTSTGGYFTSGPVAGGQSIYPSLTTDGSGASMLWLFAYPAGSGSDTYTVNATPPAGANYPVTILTGVTIGTDATLTVVLQVGAQSGAAQGGASATFAGTGFQSGTQVFFDGVAATNVVVTSSAATSRSPRSSGASALTRLTATPPAHSPGIVDVKIVNPDGLTMTIHGGYEYVSIAVSPTGRAGSSGSSGPAAPAPNVRPGASSSGVSPSPIPPHR